MNGLEAISEIKKFISTAIVVISTHDTAKMAYDATVRGALEFFAKDIFTSRMSVSQREQILTTVKHVTGIKKRIPVQMAAVKQTKVTSRLINAVVIASSTGGPRALCQLCAGLPKDFPVPIVLVQHNTTGFDRGFAQWLDGYTPLHVCLAEEAVIPVKGNLYVAPTDRHLRLGKIGFLFDDGEPVHNQKPAADLLFKSAAALYGESLVSVVLTGMGRDGAEGTRYVKQAGGVTIAQDEASSMVYGMPQAALETGCVDMTLPLDCIAQRLAFLINGGNRE
jgi:two-component system chemotaxis response regulator CheB